MLTTDDYNQISAWFFGPLSAAVSDAVESQIMEMLKEKINACEEIFSFADMSTTNIDAAKLKLTYMNGNAGSVQNDGTVIGSKAEVKNLATRFEKTGSFLQLTFDPLPASVKYVEDSLNSAKNYTDTIMASHSSDKFANKPAFDEFYATSTVIAISSHNESGSAHETRFKNYFTAAETSTQIVSAKNSAIATAQNALNTHNLAAGSTVHQARFDVHNTDASSHINLSGLANYFNKTYINNLQTTLTNKINDDITNARQFVISSISDHNTSTIAHSALFNLKAPVNSPSFTGNVSIAGSCSIGGSYIGSSIKLANAEISGSGNDITLSAPGTIYFKRGSATGFLIDSTGNTRFPSNISAAGVSIESGTTESVKDANGKSITNVEWCRSMMATIDPYGAMPDYANLQVFQTGTASYVWKVNVPGYIMTTFGHCSDVDYCLWASFDPTYLKAPRSYPTFIFKMTEGFGHGDGNQSSSMIPIFPGTKTYIRPTIDNSAGNAGNFRWIFVPCMNMRKYANQSNKFIVQLDNVNLGSRHSNINSTGFNYANQIFNTTNNADIWKTNLS